MPEIEHFQFVNRGIGAQTSTQVMLRYDAHVKPLNPDILLVQVCINDLKTIPLFPNLKKRIISNCKENIQEIVRKTVDQDDVVIVSTIFPVGKAPLERRLFWSDEIALAVNEVNDFINTISGKNVIIFDAFALLADETGMLREEYSRDELHLNEAGYDALNAEFEKLLESIEQLGQP